MLFGAGGAARAVANVLAVEGVSDIMVIVWNVERRQAMAQEQLPLCRSINVSVHPFEVWKTDIARPEVLMNPASVGLYLQDALLTPPGFRTSDNGCVRLDLSSTTCPTRTGRIASRRVDHEGGGYTALSGRNSFQAMDAYDSVN